MHDRCLTISRSHALLANPRNALALLTRALEKCNKVHSHLSSAMDISDSSPPNISISPAQVQFLKDLLEGEVQRYRALVELANLTETAHKSGGANTQPLIERLNEYPAKDVNLENLVPYPPKLEPVPVKPLFFDVAWNYIEYPGRETNKAMENGVKEAPGTSAEQIAQQKKGWFGFGR